MKVTTEKIVRHSLLVDESNLRALCSFVSDKYKVVEIRARCVDGTRLDEIQLEDLVAYSNPNSRKIKSISIDARSSISDRMALEISAGYYTRSGQLEVVSENDDRTVLVWQTIWNTLESMKPWYDWIARISWGYILSALLFAYAAWSLIPLISNWIQIKSLLIPFTVETLFYFLVLPVFIVMPATVVLNKALNFIQDALFPRVFFLLGNQRKTMGAIEFWRVSLFLGLVVAFIVGLAVNFAFEWLRGH